MIVAMTEDPADSPGRAAWRAPPGPATLAAGDPHAGRGQRSGRADHDRGRPRGRRGARPPGRVRRRGPAGQAESDMSQVAEALAAAGQQLEGDWSHPARVVVDAGTVYSQLGPMAESLGREPDDWSSAELPTGGPGAVADNDALALALDPLGPLDLLAGRGGSRSARATADGSGAPGPSTCGPPSALAGETSAVPRAVGRLVRGAAGAAGRRDPPVDVWLDGAGWSGA